MAKLCRFLLWFLSFVILLPPYFLFGGLGVILQGFGNFFEMVGYVPFRMLERVDEWAGHPVD